MVIDQTGLKLWWDVHILRRAANDSSIQRHDKRRDMPQENLERLFRDAEPKLRGGLDTKFVLDRT